jgi:hypothetical protein
MAGLPSHGLLAGYGKPWLLFVVRRMSPHGIGGFCSRHNGTQVAKEAFAPSGGGQHWILMSNASIGATPCTPPMVPLEKA